MGHGRFVVVGTRVSVGAEDPNRRGIRAETRCCGDSSDGHRRGDSVFQGERDQRRVFDAELLVGPAVQCARLGVHLGDVQAGEVSEVVGGVTGEVHYFSPAGKRGIHHQFGTLDGRREMCSACEELDVHVARQSEISGVDPAAQSPERR